MSSGSQHEEDTSVSVTSMKNRYCVRKELNLIPGNKMFRRRQNYKEKNRLILLVSFLRQVKLRSKTAVIADSSAH